MAAICAEGSRRSAASSLAPRKARQALDIAVTETCDGPASGVTEPCDEPSFSRQFLTLKRDAITPHCAVDQPPSSPDGQKNASEVKRIAKALCMISPQAPGCAPRSGPLHFCVSFFAPAFFRRKPPQTRPAVLASPPPTTCPSATRPLGEVAKTASFSGIRPGGRS